MDGKTADFTSRCPGCGKLIHRGEPIVSSPAHGGRFTHDDCADFTPEVRADLHPVCSSCFIMHPPTEPCP